MQRGFAPILIIVLIAAAALGGYFVYQTSRAKPSPKPITPPEQVGCSQDAKLCPDGSYVSRIPPKCDFAPCPLSPEASAKGDSPKESSSSADMTDWKTYTDIVKKYSISFPGNLRTLVYADVDKKNVSTGNFELIIYDPSVRDTTKEDYIEIAFYKFQPSISNEFEKSMVKINSITATKYSSSNPNYSDIYYVKDSNANIIEFIVTKDPQRSQTANKILSTFKFLP